MQTLSNYDLDMVAKTNIISVFSQSSRKDSNSFSRKVNSPEGHILGRFRDNVSIPIKHVAENVQKFCIFLLIIFWGMTNTRFFTSKIYCFQTVNTFSTYQDVV